MDIQSQINSTLLSGKTREAKKLLQSAMASGALSPTAGSIVARTSRTVATSGKEGGAMQGRQQIFPTGGGGFGGAGEIPNAPSIANSAPQAMCTAQFGGQRPFPLNCSDVLAAGAITAGTAAFDFYDAAQSAHITTNNLIPSNIEVWEARLFCGVQANTIAANETEGFYGQLELREFQNTQEVARYPLWKVGLRISYLGGVTSGAVGGFSKDIPPYGVAYHRMFDPNTPYGLELHTNVTVTTISITDWALQLPGIIGSTFGAVA